MSLFSKTTVIRESVPYTKNVEVQVHEHRAVTDESVKLLNEMQEKALANIVKSIDVRDNTLNAGVIYFLNGMSAFGNDKLIFRAKFTFNNKEYNLEGEVLRSDLSNSTYGSQVVYEAIAQKIVLLIAEKLITDISPETIRSLFLFKGSL